MSSVSTEIVLFKKRALKDNSYPIKLRIIYKRIPRYYSTGYSLTEEEFGKIKTGKARKKLKEIEIKLHDQEKKAITIINNLSVFDFEKFKELFTTSPLERQNVYYLYEKIINEFEKEDQLGSAESYRSSKKSLYEYRSRLIYTDITPKFLEGYEKYMINNEKSISTVGIYLRNLRKIYNEAIKKGYVRQEFYPFGKGRYVIPGGNNFKKSLTLDEIGQIYNYKSDNKYTSFSRDFWIFCYSCNGLNVKDALLLKFSNVFGDMIIFKREKIRNSSKQNSTDITAHLLPEMKDIIERIGNKETEPDKYIFDILKPTDKEKDIKRKTKNVVSLVNRNMKKIAKECGINKEVTCNFARHSHATNRLNSAGASLVDIQNALGHKKIETTINYLAGSSDEDIRKQVQMLIPKKKE